MAAKTPEPAALSAFDVVYESIGNSPTMRAIYHDALGPEWPDIAHPMSFVTRSELALFARTLQLSRGDLLIDLGCGSGGPGLWLARATGADVVGVDSSKVAIARAHELASREDLNDRARYHMADLTRTGLAAGTFDAAVSVDALQVLVDPRVGIREAARLLRPTGRLGFTTWETHAPDGAPLPLRTRCIPDYRPVLTAYGFDVLEHRVPRDWLRQQLAVADGIVANGPALVTELGQAAYEHLASEAREEASWLRATRAQRVCVVAERRP